MEQITAFFENIDWDAVMTVVTNYITKFDFAEFTEKLTEIFSQFIGYILGNIM